MQFFITLLYISILARVEGLHTRHNLSREANHREPHVSGRETRHSLEVSLSRTHQTGISKSKAQQLHVSDGKTDQLHVSKSETHHLLTSDDKTRQIDTSDGGTRLPVGFELQKPPRRSLNVTWRSQTPFSGGGTPKESLGFSSGRPKYLDASFPKTKAPKVSTPAEWCTNNSDCAKYDGAQCHNHLCACPADLCWSYQYLIKPSQTVFSCSTCGSLGSSCDTDKDCQPPGLCLQDHFCHCDIGENNYGVCLVVRISPEHNALTMTLGVVATILYLILCLIAFKPEGGFFNMRLCRRLPWYATSARAVERDYAAIRRARRRRRFKSQAFTHTERMRDLQASEVDQLVALGQVPVEEL